MIRYTNGNLLNAPSYALVNTVNTVGVMGKGIALQFREVFPHNFRVYQQACRKGELLVGSLLAVRDQNLLYGEHLIINFPTKTHWRLPSQYGYVEKGLTALRDLITKEQLSELAMPAPGCGNGGLNWQVVKQMVEAALGDLPCRVMVYEPLT
jgi:O-acetyl-ADP-ribose deacetylase (regulator of RNase III)